MGDSSLEAGEGSNHMASFSKLSDALHSDPQRPPFHPTLLPLLGLLGALQLWLASEWGNPTGAALGCLAVLLGLGMQLLQRMARTHAWAEGRGRVLLKGFVAFLLLLLLVRVASPDPYYDRIPDACPVSKAEGCARLSVVVPNTVNPSPPPDWKISIQDVARLVDSWAARHRGVTILGTRPTLGTPASIFVHMRAVSAFWGFADDVLLWVEMREGRKEDKGRSSLVYILGQSQLRIGKSDFGVNDARLRGLLEELLDGLAELSGDSPETQRWRTEVYGQKGMRPVKAKIPENPLRH